MLNILRLVPFGATAEQQDDTIASLAEVDAVAGALIEAQLVQTATEGMGVAEVAEAQACQAHTDASCGRSIFQRSQPLGEWRTAIVRLVDLDLQRHRLHHGS
ncbi:MAG: hypothetical protein V2A73_03560 [Pseudomonadota bacterium]